MQAGNGAFKRVGVPGGAPGGSFVAVGALYVGNERGLAADLLAARALGGRTHTVCTALIVASHGVVTDVLDVPTDTVDAQLEHLLAVTRVDGVKLGIMGDPNTIRVVFKRLQGRFDGPVVLDVTLSGPSGEDIMSPRGREALLEHLGRPDLVAVRRRDAELLAGMEIQSLDDAQVAVQRLHRLGARRVLLRCGQLPLRFFEEASDMSDFVMDLYYDGDDFSLFEAPHVPLDEGVRGRSSALLMAALRELSLRRPVVEALQAAKSYVSEVVRHTHEAGLEQGLHYAWQTPTRDAR